MRGPPRRSYCRQLYERRRSFAPPKKCLEFPLRPHVPWHLENPIEIKLGHYPLFSPLSTLNLELLNSSTLNFSSAPHAIRKPRHHANHAEIPDRAHHPADFPVLLKQPPLPEKNQPVARFRSDQRQGVAARVGHIHPDVREILEEPEAAEREACGFALPEKIGRAEQRDQQFAERSAENHDRFAEQAEEKMPAFVDDQIDVVEKQKPGAVGERVNQEQRVENKPGDSSGQRNGLPRAKFFLEERHCGKRSSRAL